MEATPDTLMMDVHKLRIGMYVFLDLGWMAHPFPLNRFKIANEQQIEQIKGLGLKIVKVLTAHSDAAAFVETPLGDNPTVAPLLPAVPTPQSPPAKSPKRQALDAQNASLARSEKMFAEAAAAWKQIAVLSQREPIAAMQRSVSVVHGFLSELTSTHETSIRLLSEISGDGGALHALNVTVVSLLLARAMKLDDAALSDVGLGALLHDIGKQTLPDRLRWHSPQFSAVEERTFREHVTHGFALSSNMGLTASAQQVIAQHHETVDGQGYPKALTGAEMTLPAKIVSLVNAYDNLCNPGSVVLAVTPHEALSLMFAQLKPRFDPACLMAFIRLMGVYPPGSVVQLSDERYALVVSVNAARPLKPCVLVFDPKVPRDEALLVDLQAEAVIGIRRSLHPRRLSGPALNYLSPRKRMSYFFERGAETLDFHVGTALAIESVGDASASDVASPGSFA
jgi:putative nucleotidyltransferase with HDIG domain